MSEVSGAGEVSGVSEVLGAGEVSGMSEVSGGRELAGAVGGGQDVLAHPLGGLDGAGHGEAGGGFAQAADFGVAGGAVLQVAFEGFALRAGQRVERVAAGQRVQVIMLCPSSHRLHQSTPRQSRILIIPSLIRVFTVPRATSSSCATSG